MSGSGAPNGLVVRGLCKAFGRHPVLTGVDLDVPPGSLTAILGPSGSGKTTLLRVVAGFERADRGSVTLGQSVVDDGAAAFVPSERRNIGYVPQEGALFPHLTVERNVGFGLPRRQRAGRVGELLEMVGLAGMGRRYPHQLSGGQQQRVALARALAVGPGLVLLDEPFSSLDAGLRSSVRADVQSVLRASATTALLVTHDQDEALSMADHVAVIRQGAIGQEGSPESVYARPADPGLARFLGEANLVAGTVEAGSVRTALGLLELGSGAVAAPGTPVPAVVLVRPEQLELDPDPARGACAGRVLDYRYFGHDAVIRVRPDDGADALVVRVAGGRPWDPGTRVGVTARGPVLAWPSAHPDVPVPPGGLGPGDGRSPEGAAR